MTETARGDTFLRLHLHGAGATLPDATPVVAPGGARAALTLSGRRADLHVAVPDRPVAEVRWIVDHAIRDLAGALGFGPGELRAGAEVSADAAVAVALDLHHRTGGRLELPDSPELAGRVGWVGAREDEYRRWVNEDAAERTSLAIARDVAALAERSDEVEAEILDEEALRERGLRLLLTVGAGGGTPPRLCLARYRPSGSTAPPLALLGKGVTFDSGGINVKPYEAFVSMMKSDMAGAALAFSLFRALVEARHPESLLLVIPTCENAIGPSSMRPGQVVKSYRGHDVRVDHTDAEGRLILADGLAYAADTETPRQVLSFATLTTAALVAYGPYATPVHFADAAWERALTAASATTGEDLHFFPERVWHLEANRDREADLRNTARLPGDASRGAGSRNAAHFLRHFADVPLCHLDIFASTWNWAGDYPGAGYGATGAPLRTLLRAFDVG